MPKIDFAGVRRADPQELTITISGPQGAGKTTLAQFLQGVLDGECISMEVFTSDGDGDRITDTLGVEEARRRLRGKIISIETKQEE